MKMDTPNLPVAIIGAGPVGLAAAAHLLARGFRPIVFEAGPTIASHLESYRHVRLFSPWQYNMDSAALRLLKSEGWQAPALQKLPTAGEIIDEYLAPLANIRIMKESLNFNSRVLQIARKGFDKVKTDGRENAPFLLRVQTPTGLAEHEAWAVIDASGTWGTPNPLGANGLTALGEDEFQDRIAYGMPDVLGRSRSRYAGKRILVAGAGHSAAGTLISLARLAEVEPDTQLVWAIRGHNFQRIFGGGTSDGLPARGELGTQLRALKENGRLALHADFKAQRISAQGGRLVVNGERTDGSLHAIADIDEIIVSTGARPDHSLSSELRVKLDAWLESTEQLAPLIDPNLHSCGTVRPHGHRELQHPEARFYAVGAKSYGRAPNFLLATGYEQVRSVVAALAGDMTAADDVHLELPETGICSTQFSETEGAECCGVTSDARIEAIAETTTAAERSGPKPSQATTSEVAAWQGNRLAVAPIALPKAEACCGGPATSRQDACCVADEVAKDAGMTGCGCDTVTLPDQETEKAKACCG